MKIITSSIKLILATVLYTFEWLTLSFAIVQNVPVLVLMNRIMMLFSSDCNFFLVSKYRWVICLFWFISKLKTDLSLDIASGKECFGWPYLIPNHGIYVLTLQQCIGHSLANCLDLKNVNITIDLIFIYPFPTDAGGKQ